MPNGINGPELPDERTVAIDEAWLVKFYARFKVVEQLEEDIPPTPPIVRTVSKHEGRIRALDLKFYAVLGAVVTGYLLNVLGIVPTSP